MANQLYRTHFQAKIEHAVAQARAVRELDHRGLAGDLRELLVAEILRPALPDTIGIATNIAMVDHLGGQSPQIDVVVFDKASLPPLVFGAATKVIPVDVCVYAIEVKTRLTATEVRDSVDKAERIASLHYVSELMERDRPRARVIPHCSRSNRTSRDPQLTRSNA